MQSIIDAVADLSFPIATAYQELIADLEIDVLTNPRMRHTRELHIIAGELNVLKKTLSPLYSMVNALRERSPEATTVGDGSPPLFQSEYERRTRGAEISARARVYLGDVADHVVILTEEIDMLRGTVDNMITMVHLLPYPFTDSDFQSCRWFPKRVYASACHGHHDFPPNVIPHGILWNEFQY